MVLSMCQLGRRICGFCCVLFFLASSPVTVTVFCEKCDNGVERAERVRIQCQKTPSEQALRSEGDRKITVDTEWLRQKQQYSA